MPHSNAFLTSNDLAKPERRDPLRVLVCETCWLVQTEDFAGSRELFTDDYAYFSGYSKTWLAHIQQYVFDAIARFRLGNANRVVEIGTNDGSLLQFVKAAGIPCLGVEPTASTAACAEAKGLSVVRAFFGADLARDLASAWRSDLIVANNVLAHVPDINDFVKGVAMLLQPSGVATFEFPHLVRLIAENQFDTIYHEHFSYLSLTAVARIFAANDLTVFDVQEIPTHGGSLRVFAQRPHGGHERTPTVRAVLDGEAKLGVSTPAYYAGFQPKAERVKNDLGRFLTESKGRGQSVVAYGAAAKGNTLLNFAGVRGDLISFVVDANPAKQGRFMPGSHIPIVEEENISRSEPDYVVILPWNISQEVMEKLEYIRSWGGRFVTAIPGVAVHA